MSYTNSKKEFHRDLVTCPEDGVQVTIRTAVTIDNFGILVTPDCPYYSDYRATCPPCCKSLIEKYKDYYKNN